MLLIATIFLALLYTAGAEPSPSGKFNVLSYYIGSSPSVAGYEGDPVKTIPIIAAHLGLYNVVHVQGEQISLLWFNIGLLTI